MSVLWVSEAEFQLGHVFSDMDCGIFSTLPILKICFNWATSFQTWIVNANIERERLLTEKVSIGPRLFRHGLPEASHGYRAR